MARLAVPNRSVAAVFVKTKIDGQVAYVREPYNVVALDWGDGSPIKTYMEPAEYLVKSPSFDEGNTTSPGADASMRPLVFQELRIYDAPPWPHQRPGVPV